MEAALASGKDVLALAFSSGLSATYQSAVIAADELQEKYPDRKIRVVDTACASLGQGLFVYHACKQRDAGLSLEELTAWAEENKLKLCHWFTVDDLMFLKRGGRVSAATAVVGTMLQIKPVLHVDNEGRLINVSKARGRKASIDALVKKMEETMLHGVNDVAFICHGDCLEDAKYLEKLVKERCGVKEVFIGYTGAVIGSHAGPGVLALFYLGEHR
jgi:DegV family protein with EDD domain